MKRSINVIIVFLLFMQCQMPLKEDQFLIENLLKQNPAFQEILADLDKYEVQVIYTKIDRDDQNRPHFSSFYFNTDSTRYFYPASTVKMPIALLALEKLNELGIEGLDMNSTFFTDSAHTGQTPVLEDTTAQNGLPSVAQYIKKIFVVSDNDAYNRLYEFLGQEYIHQKLQDKGFTNSRIIHRLSIPLSIEENQLTNPVRFYNGDSLIYSQPLVKSRANYQPKEQILKGKAHISTQDSLVEAPFDFTYKNFIPLAEMQRMLRDVIFPSESPMFNLGPQDYALVYQYMSQLPRETTYPTYSLPEYYDAYCKYLMFGEDRDIPSPIRIFNKIGQAYGYLIDNAYIIDLENNIEFFLSAVIHVNENETYNDGGYEYKTIGYPFMKELGQTLYNYELTRTRSTIADLTRFKLDYDK
ncbi:MAG: class A beta-lactamase-related serine hydrolase [Cytophagales bacterium]|nr:class A beta-lactamase-related serine hydrolase [Cytophagales bacterium]